MNYQVSDFIIRLKNAAMARRHEVVLPFSKLNKAIGKVLVKKGFLDEIHDDEVLGKKILRGKIRYERRSPVLQNVEIFSKPSLRQYLRKADIKRKERKRLGTVILTTSMGVLTGEEAKKKGVGGELLFEIW